MRPAHTLALVLLPWLFAGPLGCNSRGGEDDGKHQAPADASKSKDGEAEDGKGIEAAGTCDEAHGKAVEAEMLSWCELSEQVASSDIPLAPWKPTPADDPGRKHVAGRIEVGPGTIKVGWGNEVSLAELPTELRIGREVSEREGKPHESFALTIGGDTPRAEVAALLRTLHDAEHREGTLVLTVEPPVEVPKPRDPKRLAELDEMVADADPSQRATMLAKEIEAAMPPCPGMVEAFSTVATVAADQRCPVLARGFAEGLVGCNCPKEDEMLTLIYGISLGFEPPTRLTTTAPVILDPSAKPREGATWAEIVAGLDEAALKTLWVD